MDKLLIVARSETLRIQLREALGKNYAVTDCGDGATALELLDSVRPDALILDVELPYADGLSVLEEATCQPEVVLCLATFATDYTLLRAADLGVKYVLTKPCPIRIIAKHLDYMCAARYRTPALPPSHQAQASMLLQDLGIDLGSDGGFQLRIAIPLFAQDPAQRIVKELYPAVQSLCRNGTGDVEYTMRRAIQSAWENRDTVLWAKYFPGATKCPSNKVFIARMAHVILYEK